MSEETTKKASKKKYYDNVSVAKRTKQVVYFVQQQDKAAMFVYYLKNREKKQTVVVVKSKRRADELCGYLNSKDIKTTAIHGNHRRQQIEEAAKAFTACKTNILITTDKILQSLELSNIEAIINYDLPPDHEDYFSRLILVDEVGESILFVSHEDDGYLTIIEMRQKNEIPQEELENFVSSNDEAAHSTKAKKKKPRHRKKKTSNYEEKKKEE